jgi:hypothetical protein
MKAANFEFCSRGHINKQVTEELQQHVIKTTFLQEDTVKWITDTMPATVPLEYEGVDSCGIPLKVSMVIPQLLLKPPSFNVADWPLNTNGTMFDAERKYNYMINMDVNSLANYPNKDSIVWKAINDLYMKEQLQTRYRSIWHEMQSAVFAVDSYLGHENHPVRYVLKHLVFRKGMPFLERNGQIENTTMPNVSTLLPAISYMLMSVCTDICSGTVTLVEAAFTINHYLQLARVDYCDEKLRIKSAMRDWFGYALGCLGQIYYPKYNTRLQICGLGSVKGVEPSFIHDQHVKKMKDMEEKLSGYDEILSYIKRHEKAKTIEQVIDRLEVCYAMSNDRTFYKTLVELSLDAAVKPQMAEKLVLRPTTVLKDLDEGYAWLTEFDAKLSKGMYWAQRYLKQFVRTIADKVSLLDLDSEWLHFLTTSSPGQKLDDETQGALKKELGVLVKTRFGLEAFQASEYRSIQKLILSLAIAIMLVQRQQIDRRQRVIAGLNNARLLLSLASYLIMRFMYKLSEDSAQGKQVGNALDLYDLMIGTTQTSVIISSIDIKGYDASVQPLMKELMNGFCKEVAMRVPNGNLGPFTDTVKDLQNALTGEQEQYRVSGLWQAVTFETNNAQTSTTLKSKYFGEINNQDGTFPSGRADTSAHHTIGTSALFRGNRMRRRQDESVTYHASTNMLSRGMGDDRFDVYAGPYDAMVEEIESDGQVLAEAGFETTSELSSHSGEFLQQHCARGRYVPKPSRVSFFTTEHIKEKRYLHGACSELLSVMDDMISRVKDPKGLKLLVFSIALHCINRTVMNVTLKDLVKVEPKMKSNNIKYHVYDRKVDGKKSGDFRLVSIYVPIMWFFMHKGGELPCWPIQRSDGTYTQDESVYTVRGEAKRKLIYDIIGIKSIKNVQKSVSENRQYLTDLGVNAADAIITLKIADIKEEVRSERLPYDEIQHLAQGLQQYTDQAKYDRSYLSYQKITRELEQTNLTRGFSEDNENVEIVGRGKNKIPRSVVLAFELPVKLEQVLITKEVDLSEVPFLSQRFVDHFASLNTKHLFGVQANDVLHLHTFDDMDERLVCDQMVIKVLSKVRLNSNMTPGSMTWLLYSILGTINMEKNIVRREIGWLRGKYANFKMEDERIRVGYEVMWRSHRHLMPDYFEMIGASPKMQQLMTDSYKYADEQGAFRYPYIQPSRNNFFISDDPASCLDNVDIRMGNTPMTYALYIIFGYLHFMSHIESIYSKQRLWVSPLLESYVKANPTQVGIRT